MSKLYYGPAMDLTDQLRACIGFSCAKRCLWHRWDTDLPDL